MADGMDLKKLKKKKKVAISITVDSENLSFLKEDMKNEGVDDMPLSLIFDNFLRDFVDFRKMKIKENKESKEVDKKEGENET